MINYDAFLSRTGAAMRPSAIRQMGSVMAQVQDLVSFAPGYPAEDLFPWHEFQEIAREVLSGTDGASLQYGPTRGYRPLRDAVTGLMHDRGAITTAERVVITTGSQQGLDLVARVLLDPGDVALMELPSYTGAISAFTNVGASLVGIQQDIDGVDLDHLDATVTRLRAEGRRVKFFYMVPNFQNPTGLLLSLQKRAQVREWAGTRDLLVVEDDPYRDLYFDDVTTEAQTRPIVADDAEDRVIYLSSFSKTLAPGFRVGWISAPPALAAKIEFAKQAEDLCTGGLDQRIAYEACRRGILARHVPTLRAAYREKRDAMLSSVTRALSSELTWTAPRGGFFLWATLTSSLTADALLPFAQARGVIYVVGSAFFVDGTGQSHLRLSFSAPSPARIEEGVTRLAAAVTDAHAGAMV